MQFVEQKEEFDKARQIVRSIERAQDGIGTLSEKSVHAVAKYYLVPKKEYHECKINGFIADIFFEEEVFEIQTAQFYKLRAKLDTFLKEYDVTIVYPLPIKKTILWMDPNTWEIVEKRKSSRNKSIYTIFLEMYQIRSYIRHERLHFRLLLMEIEEQRLLDGYGKSRKIRANRRDKIPMDLVEDIFLDSKADYERFLPTNLPDQFTSKEFSKAAKIHIQDAQITLLILSDLEIVDRVDKKGNQFIYQRNKNESQLG